MEPDKQRAFNLFFQTDFTQQQIAELLNINRKTLYLWMKEGGWRRAKYAAMHAPSVLIEQYYSQLGAINIAISQRIDHPFPTKEESDIIRRLTMTIKQMRDSRPTVAESVQVIQCFTDRLMRKNLKLTHEVIPYFDEYIKTLGEKGQALNYSKIRIEDERFDKEYELWEASQTSESKPAPIQTNTTDSSAKIIPGNNPNSTTPETSTPIPNSKTTPPSPSERAGDRPGASNGASPAAASPPQSAPNNNINEINNIDLSTKKIENEGNHTPENTPETIPLPGTNQPPGPQVIPPAGNTNDNTAADSNEDNRRLPSQEPGNEKKGSSGNS